MAESIQVDRIVDQFKITELAGQDQYREHYTALDVDSGDLVALSIIKRELAGYDSFIQDYLHRTQTLIQIRHPNLTTYLYAGLVDSVQPYVTSEPVSGFTLGDRIERLAQEKTPAHTVYALALVRQAASGLGLLEQLELFHHELTPQYILLRSVTLKSEESVVVTDLDIPDQYAGEFFEYSPYATNYLSPEQLSGNEIDGRSHVYSLGVVLHQLLCGELPQGPMTFWRKMWFALNGGSTLDRLRPDLSDETRTLVERALTKNKRRRFSSLTTFKASVDSALTAEDMPVHADTKSGGQARRPRPVFLIPLVMLLICGVLGLLSLWLLPGMVSESRSPVIAASEQASADQPATAAPSPSSSAAPSLTPSAVARITATVQTDRGAIKAEENRPEISPGADQATSSPMPSRTATATVTETPTPADTATIPPSATPAPTATARPAFRVLTSSASLRLGPGTIYERSGFVLEDENLEIIGRSGGNFSWLNVRTESGQLGWVAFDVGELIWPPDLSTIALAATIPPAPTLTATPTSTPIPPTPLPLPASGGGGGGGNNGGGNDDKPRSTPTPPL